MTWGHNIRKMKATKAREIQRNETMPIISKVSIEKLSKKARSLANSVFHHLDIYGKEYVRMDHPIVWKQNISAKEQSMLGMQLGVLLNSWLTNVEREQKGVRSMRTPWKKQYLTKTISLLDQQLSQSIAHRLKCGYAHVVELFLSTFVDTGHCFGIHDFS